MPTQKRTFGPSGGVHDLTEKVEERAQFIEWLATPKSEQDPSSQNALADRLGVARATLVRWGKTDAVIAAVNERRRQVFSVRQLSDVWETLYGQATDAENTRSVAAARLMLEFHERTAPKEKVDVPLADMPLAELKHLVADLHDEIDDRIDQDAESA